MYDRILVAIDATPTEENRSAQTRAEQIGRLTGATVYVLHVARGHIIPGDIIGGAGFGVRSADEDVEGADRQAVQVLVDRLSAAGVDAHGEIVSATQHDVASAILQRASGTRCGPAGALGTNTIAAPATRSAQVWLTGLSITTRRFRSYWPDLLAGADHGQ